MIGCHFRNEVFGRKKYFGVAKTCLNYRMLSTGDCRYLRLLHKDIAIFCYKDIA